MQPSAWLRGIAVALILLAAVLPTAARALAGPEGATIHVRWQASVSEANRRDIETRRYLFDGRRIDQDTWQYDLAEPSRENIHELLIEPAVEDTHGLDRPNESLDPATGRTSRRQRFPDYGDQLVMGADLLAITSGALALLLTFVGAKRRRANSASRTPDSTRPPVGVRPRRGARRARSRRRGSAEVMDGCRSPDVRTFSPRAVPDAVALTIPDHGGGCSFRGRREPPDLALLQPHHGLLQAVVPRHVVGPLERH